MFYTKAGWSKGFRLSALLMVSVWGQVVDAEAFVRGPRTSTETFFAQCVDTSVSALSVIPEKMRRSNVFP